MPEEGLTVEDRARQRGWVPLEEWKGDPDKALDAVTFLERAEENLPLLRSNVKMLEKKLAGMEQELRDTRATFKEYNEHQKKAHERELDRLKKHLRDAAAEGDTEKFDAIQGEIDNLSQPGKVDPAGAIAGNRFNDVHALNEWKAENSWWFEEDVDMAEYANRVDRHLAAVRTDLDHRAHLAELTKRVRKKFPDKFGDAPVEDPKPRKANAPPLGGSDGDAGVKKPTGKNTYASLPDEAKKACDRFCKNIPGFTQEQYLKEYYGE